MNMSEAMIILSNLIELQTITETLATPDGRWQALQNWLNQHPKWRAQVESWANMTPDAAFDSLRDYAAERAGMPAPMLNTFISAEMRARINASIQTLQELYRDRKEQSRPAGFVSDMHPITDATPTAHKTLHDYQGQLKAKQKRPRRQHD